MRKLLKLLILSTCLTSNYSLAREAKVTQPYAKAKEFYIRYDSNLQPVFKHSEKDFKLLIAVNHEVNGGFSYIAEPKGQDYWQTPAETLNIGGGDCEDFAILKWKMLLDAGIPEKDMYFLQGVTEDTKEPHVELVVKLNDETYYLDNRN